MHFVCGNSTGAGNDRYSIADIALFACTRVAHEGGFDLSGYGSVNKWIDRVRQQDGYVAMTAVKPA